MRKIPKVLFGAVDLCRVTGGISVLARAAFRVLVEMHLKGKIDLHALVLNEAGPDSGDDFPVGTRFSNIRWCSGSKARFSAEIVIIRPDLAIFDHVGPARAARVLPGLIRPPYCVFVHGVEIDEQVRRDYVETLRGATLLIANSHYTRKRVESLGVDIPPLDVCWPGIEEEACPRFNIDDPILKGIGECALLIVGRLAASQRHKGHDHLLECMPIITSRVPDAQLVIAGDGDDRDRLQQKAVALGVDDNVVFTGWVSREILNSLYRKCAVFVMPSKGDGFGFVYLEAMSHHKPCVGLVNSSAEEIIVHGITGLLVDSERQNEMTASISGLLENRQICNEMGRAGQLRLKSMFMYDNFAERLQCSLYRVLSPWRQ